MEVGQAVLSLHLVDAELDFAKGMVFVFLEVGEGDFKDAAFKGVVGVFETGCAVYERLANTVNLLVPVGSDERRHIVLSDVKRRWGFHGEPVFPGEWIGLLLEALLAL